MKKLIALLLALVMVIGLASCGQPAGSNTPDGGAPSSTEPDGPGESGQPEGATPLAGKHIGLMIYSTTTPWAMNIIDTIQSLCDSLGMQLTVAEAGTPNDVITAAENLLSANIDGMLCAMDGGIANKVMELTEAQQVYTTFTFTNILDEEYYDEIANSEYYAGSINSQDYEAAYDMTQHCIDLGADQWVYLGMPEGSGPSIDARADGFKACLADNNLELSAHLRQGGGRPKPDHQLPPVERLRFRQQCREERQRRAGVRRQDGRGLYVLLRSGRVLCSGIL